MTALNRREVLASGLAAAGMVAFGPAFWRNALAAPATPAPSPYGPLGAPNALGIAVPEGFTVREVARAGQAVHGYTWHPSPDGMATFARPEGGWYLVSNAETDPISGGGVSALRFGADGTSEAAYRICGGTQSNCGGGPTPWGTWLTCEEHRGGRVYECDPTGASAAVVRPALGAFAHEAAAVDPVGKRVYMTEDESEGGFYRFTPRSYPDLTAGLLEIAVVGAGGATTWVEVPDPAGWGPLNMGRPTRLQVPAATKFNGGEGIWFDSGWIYFTTKGDSSLWAYDTQTAKLERIHDEKDAGANAFIYKPDNVTVSRSGDLFVCEDNGQAEYDVVMMTPDRGVSTFLRCSGPQQAGSELAGVTFTPDGNRMYVASQRAYGVGAVYEISGPFRPARAKGETPGQPTPGGPEPKPVPVPVPSPAAQLPPTVKPGTTIHDADAPGLTVRCASRISLADLRGRGLEVTVRADEDAAVTVGLRTAALKSQAGRGGATPRPITETFYTKRVQGRAGRSVKAVAKVSDAEARRVAAALDRASRRGRKAQVQFHISVQGRDAAGNVAVATRKVLVTGPARRTRSTASRRAA